MDYWLVQYRISTSKIQRNIELSIRASEAVGCRCWLCSFYSWLSANFPQEVYRICVMWNHFHFWVSKEPRPQRNSSAFLPIQWPSRCFGQMDAFSANEGRSPRLNAPRPRRSWRRRSLWCCFWWILGKGWECHEDLGNAICGVHVVCMSIFWFFVHSCNVWILILMNIVKAVLPQFIWNIDWGDQCSRASDIASYNSDGFWNWTCVEWYLIKYHRHTHTAHMAIGRNMGFSAVQKYVCALRVFPIIRGTV